MSKSSEFSVIGHGAVSDGFTLNTAAFQAAIDQCSQTGGGAVVVPAGRFVIGTLILKDNVTLHLAKDATLLGSPNAADYQNPLPFKDGTGAELGAALILAIDAKNVGIEGEGTIDGQGKAVSAAQGGGKNYTMRPFLIRWERCAGVTVRGVHLTNPGAWTMHFSQCQDVLAEKVTIRSHGLSNNDGIDIDSCQRVVIKDCDIDSGDDAICFKATSGKPCRDVTVSNCRLKSNCGAIKFGTESVGDFENINISHCQIRDTRLGGIKIFSVDGAHLQNVTISDITMDNVATPIFMRLGERLKTFRPNDEKKPVAGIMKNVTIRNIVAKSADKATISPPSGIFITGIPGYRIENVTLENISIELPGGGTREDGRRVMEENIKSYPEINRFGPGLPAFGIYARHVAGLKLRDIKLSLRAPDARPAIVCIDGVDLDLERIAIPGNADAESVIRLESVTSAALTSIAVEGTAQSFLRVEGESSSGIELKEIHLAVGSRVSDLGDGVPSSAVTQK
ncbi:MAG: glycoside hydrolase family 28 protein [Burkholderiales bacterium]|nr:glycoside hydrolase family 28 protein [Phycisphaerae bacterium]